MRYKFTFEKNIKEDSVTVFESSEVDNDFVVMYEGKYLLQELANASKEGIAQFFLKLRRTNFFPDTRIATKLYEATLGFFSKDSEIKIVIDYDDIESLSIDEIEDEDIEVEDLLSDDGDTSKDDTKEIDTKDDTPKSLPEDTSEHEK